MTGILRDLERGDESARERLFPLVFAELRQLARHVLGDPHGRGTLQPTAIVDDAYVRLLGKATAHFTGKRHFFAVAAKAMRQVVVDHARERAAAKRGAGWERVTLHADAVQVGTPDIDALALDAALQRLAELDQLQAQVVELRVFGGLKVLEIAALLEVSGTTVKDHWRCARAWLLRELSEEEA